MGNQLGFTGYLGRVALSARTSVLRFGAQFHRSGFLPEFLNGDAAAHDPAGGCYSVPTRGNNVPDDRNAMSAREYPVPGGEYAVPDVFDEVSAGANEMSRLGDAVPGVADQVSANDHAMPDDHHPVSRHPDVLSARDDGMPGGRNALPAD